MNNSVFQVGDELIVEKGKEGMVNRSQWNNTGKYWTRGSNTKSRTTERRGTHKVFKSRAKQIRRAELAAQRASVKQRVNEISAQISAMALGARGSSPNGGPLPINEEFMAEIMATENPNTIVYGKKFSRGILNSNIPILKEYAMIRASEGKTGSEIVKELTALRNTGQLIPALNALKKSKKNLNDLNAMLAGLGMEGGKKRRHTKRRSHTKRRHTRRH